MSADNWADCPGCAKQREVRISAAEKAVADSYGQVSVDEFDAARAELARLKSGVADPTFREDYEIYGAEDGEVKVTYSGRCSVCGLSLKFEHAHPLDVGGRS